MYTHTYTHIQKLQWFVYFKAGNKGLPCGSAGEESTAVQETWFDPWVGKIPWRMERLPTPVFWPGEFHGWYSTVHGVCYTHTCTHIQRLKGFVYFKAGNKIALDHYHCINILVRVRAKHCWRLHFLYKSSVMIPVLT